MSGDFRLDRAQVRRAFARAARIYEQHDALQREVGQRLREQLALCENPPQRILDLGAGTGLGAAALARHYPEAHVIALDLALPMLHAARRHAGWRGRRYARVAGDAPQLPFADGVFDLLHSNLCIQWIADPRPLFVELLRVLRPGGFLLLSSFGHGGDGCVRRARRFMGVACCCCSVASASSRRSTSPDVCAADSAMRSRA